MRSSTVEPRAIVKYKNIDKLISPLFYPLLENRSRFLVLVGGAGSGKSWFAAQKIVLRCLANPGHRIGVLRKVARTVRHSCFDQVREVIASFGMSDLWKANLTDLTLTCTANGSQILFMGLDDPEKLKSIFGLTSVWIEEATELTWRDFSELDRRVRGIRTQYKQLMLSLNPISAQHWIKKRLCDGNDIDTTIVHSTYKDNPFLDSEYCRQLEKLQETDSELWTIYGRGEWGQIQGIIYPNVIVDEERYDGGFDELIAGLDFGFTNPTSLHFYGLVGERQVYVREIIYKSGLTNKALIQAMKDAGVPYNMPIYADCEDPARIEEIGEEGFNIFACDKGAGSVSAGIDLCRSMEIHTDEWNTGFNSELLEYHWSKDRNGDTVDGVPAKVNDHAMDDMRYALFTHLRERRERSGIVIHDMMAGYDSPIADL